jgi:hypothetical protein
VFHWSSSDQTEIRLIVYGGVGIQGGMKRNP